MEAFEHSALEHALFKPRVFHLYVDDTFIIWTHGQGKLMEFLSFMNSLYKNTKFTMEVEQSGSFSFLDVFVYRKQDGSLGHKVFQKPPHTDLYFNARSAHHPAPKRAALSTLVHRATAISDKGSLPEELFKTSMECI